MSQEVPSIGAAIEEFTAEETDESVGTDVVTADDDTDVDEGEPVGEEAETEEEAEEEGDVPDIEDDDEWGDDPDSEDDDEDEDEDGEDEDDEEDSEDEDDVDDPFENLTADQIEKINTDPGLRVLKKALMRGYNKKMQGKSQLIQLGEAYEADPVGVARAIAHANGLTVAEAHAAGKEAAATTTDPAQQKIDAIEQARTEVADLFGEQVGPEVATKLENFFNVLTETVVAPLSNQVGTITAKSEQARMMSEEAAWRNRNKEILTPEIEKAVVELGNSGTIVPGDNMAPGDYLDTLTKVVMADYADGRVKTARAGSSKRLAKRIARNRADREPTGVGGKAGVRKVSRLETEPEKFSISSAMDQAARELKDSVG